MYLMEISPIRYRGAAGTTHQIAVAFSDWISLLCGMPNMLGNERWWPIAFALPGIPALLLCIILPYCPESPFYTFINRDDHRRAFDDIIELVGETNADEYYQRLIHEANTSTKVSRSDDEMNVYALLASTTRWQIS